MLEDSCSLCRILPEISTINIKKFVSRLVDDSLPQIHSLIFDTRVQAYRATFWRRESILSLIYKKKKEKKENIFEMIELLVKTQNLFYSLSPSAFAFLLTHSSSLFYFFSILFDFILILLCFSAICIFFNSLFTQF